MAKDTITPRPGALKAALSKAGITQADLVKKIGGSRTTIIDVNKGKKVKTETLQKIADSLRRPITDFTAVKMDDVPDFVITERDDLLGSWADVLVRPISSNDDLRKVLEGTDAIQWRLHLKDLPDEIATELAELERRITEFNTFECMFAVRQGESLAKLIEINKTQRGMSDYISALAERGIYLYGTRYSRWTMEEDKNGDRFDSEYPGWLDYESKQQSLLVLDTLNVNYLRISVCIGNLPPLHATNTEPRIKVNGTWLEKIPLSKELDEDIPF